MSSVDAVDSASALAEVVRAQMAADELAQENLEAVQALEQSYEPPPPPPDTFEPGSLVPPPDSLTQGDLAVLEASAPPGTYVVQPGDSYTQIAENLLAAGVPGIDGTYPEYGALLGDMVAALAAELKALNDGQALRAGDTIELPDVMETIAPVVEEHLAELSPDLANAYFADWGSATSADYLAQLQATAALEGAFDNPFALANLLLGFDAKDLQNTGILSTEMPSAGATQSCVAFVTGALEEAGWIGEGQAVSGVLEMKGVLEATGAWQEVTSLDQLQPGDVVVIENSFTSNGHAVMYAGQDAAGNHLFIGSNNINTDGTQEVSYGILDPEQVSFALHYTGDRGNPNGTADGDLTTYGGLPQEPLSPGQSGYEVKKLQEALQKTGHLPVDALGVSTGTYEAATMQAVMDFQAEHGLPVTGIVDADTLSALKAELRPRSGGRGR